MSVEDRDELVSTNIKEQKMSIQKDLETYLEEEKIHDIFQDMMMALIKDKPKDPIKFLVEKLKKPESKFYFGYILEKRIVIVTPPGMKGGNDAMNEEQYNVGLMLEQHLKEVSGFDTMQTISVGDLLQREITMHSKYGELIS